MIRAGLALIWGLAVGAGAFAQVPSPAGDGAADGIQLTVEVDISRDTEQPEAGTGDLGSGEGEALARPHDVDAMLERIAALERRVEELESAAVRPDPAPPPSAPPEAVGFGGGGAVVVRAGQTVEEAVSVAGPVEVYGTVLHNAVAMGADVTVHDGGEVLGDAVSFGGAVHIADGGSVAGERVTFGGTERVDASLVPPVTVSGAEPEPVQGLVRKLSMALSLAAVGVLVAGFWPRQVDRVAEVLGERPFWYGVAGAILAATLVLASLALTLTVIGIPFAVLLLLLLGLGWLFGFIGVCQHVGGRMARGAKGGWVAFLLGATVVAVVGFLPYIGPAVIMVLGFPALGAGLVSRLGVRQDPDAI